MGKKIIWTPAALSQLEDSHEIILYESKSINIADRIIDEIIDSAEILSNHSEIYSLDRNKSKNDGSYRSYQKHSHTIAYRVLEQEIRILRVRHSSQEPMGY